MDFILSTLEKLLAPVIDKVRTGNMVAYVIVVVLMGGVITGVEYFGPQYIGIEWVEILLQVLAFIMTGLTNPINEPILAKHNLGKYKQSGYETKRVNSSRD